MGIPSSDSLREPIQYLPLNPADPVRAESYPFGEFPCTLKAVDVLRSVQDVLTELLFREYSHRCLLVRGDTGAAPVVPDQRGKCMGKMKLIQEFSS